MIQVILTLLIAVGLCAAWTKRKSSSLIETFMPPLSYRFEEPPPRAMTTTLDYNTTRQPAAASMVPQPARMMSSSDMLVRPRRAEASDMLAPPTTNFTLNYTVPPNQTSNVAPRVADVPYTSALQGPVPDTQYLAVDPMNPLGLSQSGQLQPVIYPRAIYANKMSRLFSLGDPIRGDLPIAPLSGDNWFKPAVTPHIDLREGAMTVMGGRHNDTTNELGLLKYQSTYGGHNINAGAEFSPDNEMVMQTSGMIPLYREMVNNVGDVTIATRY